jgi:hypothetical protein
MAYITPNNPDNQPPVQLPGTRIPSRIVVLAICAGFCLVAMALGFVYITMAQGYSRAFAEMAEAALPW